MQITFGPAAAELLLPLVQQDVEVSRTLEEAEVAGGRRRRENPLKLTHAGPLVFAGRQHADVLRSQDVQHRGQEVLAGTGGDSASRLLLKHFSALIECARGRVPGRRSVGRDKRPA